MIVASIVSPSRPIKAPKLVVQNSFERAGKSSRSRLENDWERELGSFEVVVHDN
tara:strand:- start:21 stop:182 length:162 start_codon:yes stop_codon:yes gene_type:complete